MAIPHRCGLMALVGALVLIVAGGSGCKTAPPPGPVTLGEAASPVYSVGGAGKEFTVDVSPAGDTIQMVPRVGRIIGFVVDEAVNDDNRRDVRAALEGYDPGAFFREHLRARLAEHLEAEPAYVPPMGGYAGYAHAREARKAFMERLAERGHDVWLDMDVLYGLYESHVELRLEIGARVLRVPSGYRLWNGDIEATAEPLLANHSFDFILARFSPYFRKPELAVEAGAVAEFTKNGAVRLREDFEAAVRRACSALLIRAELADEALGRQCLGRTAFLDKDFEEAERELRRAVELEPDCAAAWSDLAAALAKLDRDEDALEAARRAIALDGDCGPALFNAAWLLAKRLERPAEAAGFYERALRQGMSGDDDLEEALHYGG